jgi:importin-5
MLCLTSLKTAIDFPMDAGTKEKKSKQTQFYHARDNAVAALGKVLKFQPSSSDLNQLVPFWMNLIPLTHDMEEAHIQNQFLAEAVLKNPAFILGG